MKYLTLYKDDIAHGSVMSWDGLLGNLGVETHTIVAGRTIDKEIDSVTVAIHGNSVVCHSESGEVIGK
jgi:hypothetical protein